MIDTRMIVVYRTLRARNIPAMEALTRARKLHVTLLNMFAAYQ